MPLAPPVQVRFTPQQTAVLRELRERDGLPVQEHIRRAIDFYLAAWLNAKDAGVAPPASAPSQAALVPDHVVSVVLEKPLKNHVKVVRR